MAWSLARKADLSEARTNFTVAVVCVSSYRLANWSALRAACADGVSSLYIEA